MKAVVVLLAASVFVWVTALGQGQFLFTWGPFQYSTNRGAVTITGYTGPGGAVTIPDMIAGLPVTSIGKGAFSGLTTLTGITIPNSVNRIEMGAFGDCPRLTGIALPTGVTNVELWAFRGCINLKAITVDALNPVYSSGEGVVFDKKQTAIVLCPPGKTGSYRIPNTVTNIIASAFLECTKLTEVLLPDSVTTIGGEAFSGCTGLSNITVPDSVNSVGADTFSKCSRLRSVTLGNGLTSIPMTMFYYCTNLTGVTIPNGVTSIGSQAFDHCTQLTSAVIPNSVTRIEPQAFFSCINLTEIILPNRLTSIGLWAFNGCINLTSMTIPNTVTNIGEGPFVGCTGLTAIAVDPLNPAYGSLEGVLFNRMHDTLVQYPGGKAGSYVVPNGVTNIGTFAFSDCTHLTEVIIPNGVSSIPDDAFANCWSLTSLTIPSTVRTIGNGAFRSDTSLKRIYFEGNAPALGSWVFGGSSGTVYYLPEAEGWGASFGDRPTAVWLPEAQLSDTVPDVQTNRFSFVMKWVNGATIIVEACTDIDHPTWSPVSTNRLNSGSSNFSDSASKDSPRRFYRLRSLCPLERAVRSTSGQDRWRHASLAVPCS